MGHKHWPRQVAGGGGVFPSKWMRSAVRQSNWAWWSSGEGRQDDTGPHSRSTGEVKNRSSPSPFPPSSSIPTASVYTNSTFCCTLNIMKCLLSQFVSWFTLLSCLENTKRFENPQYNVAFWFLSFYLDCEFWSWIAWEAVSLSLPVLLCQGAVRCCRVCLSWTPNSAQTHTSRAEETKKKNCFLLSR